MRKIIELDIIFPYYEAMYKVGKEICIFEGQPGLQVIWENKNN